MKYYYQIEGQVRNNIGDVLQGMVAKAFLPITAEVVDREALSEMNTAEPGFFIANGWYMHSFEKFPPPNNVTPLYISVHVANSAIFLKPEVVAHFKKHAPIGCRDTKTLKLFLGWGIPAYFSGCLTTTTLPRTAPKNDSVILVDNIDHPIPENVYTKLEKVLNTKLLRISHDPVSESPLLEDYNQDCQVRMNELLSLYCGAKLVLTTKIHCALPCLAMGANVMLIHPDPTDPRLNTVNEFLETISYKRILESDSLPIPTVNTKALQKRRGFLSNIVNRSIEVHDNILKVSSTPFYWFIRQKSRVNAFVFRATVVLLYNLGYKTDQIGRVYGLKK